MLTSDYWIRIRRLRFIGIYAGLRQIIRLRRNDIRDIQFAIPTVKTYVECNTVSCHIFIRDLGISVEGSGYLYPAFARQFFCAVIFLIIYARYGISRAKVLVTQHLIKITVEIFRSPNVERKRVVFTNLQVLKAQMQHVRAVFFNRFRAVIKVYFKRRLTFGMYFFIGNGEYVHICRALFCKTIAPPRQTFGVLPRSTNQANRIHFQRHFADKFVATVTISVVIKILMPNGIKRFRIRRRTIFTSESFYAVTETRRLGGYHTIVVYVIQKINRFCFYLTAIATGIRHFTHFNTSGSLRFYACAIIMPQCWNSLCLGFFTICTGVCYLSVFRTSCFFFYHTFIPRMYVFLFHGRRTFCRRR